jgi:uncharacterized protein YxjI
MKPRLIVEQKITVFVNQYSIYAANDDGSKGELLAFAQQKRLAFKEKVSFYTTESKENLVFTFRAEKVMDVHGKYIVEDTAGAAVGGFKKEFTQSLVKSTWNILDADDGVKLKVSESNALVAIMRRFGGMIPIVGAVIDLVMPFFKYHFVFTDTTGQTVGKYEKTTLIRDNYILSMTDESYTAEDWRVLAAMAVALDALQSR